MTPLLEIEGLSKNFGGLKALDNVSFKVQKGSIKAVIGPNGAGKTTLFNLISGYLAPGAGDVVFEGQSIRGFKPYQVAGRAIARTFQHIRLFHGMTALENVMLGRHRMGRAGFISGMLGTRASRREEVLIRQYALEVMDLIGIADLAGADATSLAFGQQRGVELARALALEPKLVLLDEPAAGLNMHETAEVAKLIEKIRDSGVTVLIVEHDMSLVMNISDEVLVLSYGQKIAEDAPLSIQKNQEVIKIYLGEDDA